MKKTFAKKRVSFTRRAATAVEFAMVAPILFLSIFACIDFGRLMMVESIVEQSAFEAARNVAVIGAIKQDAKDLANSELFFFGIESAEITVTPLVDGSAQQEINHATEQVSVTVSVPFKDVAYVGWFSNGSRVERTAVIDTERFEY